MAKPERGDIVPFDAEAAREAALDATEGTLYSFVEFDSDEWNALHVAPETREMYESEAQMEEHFDRIHDYVNLDFTEIDLFTQDLLPIADEVRYITTAMDVMTFVRVYVDRSRGVFLALDAEEPVEPVVSAIEPVID